jgi:hypothetical protein
MSSQLDTDNDDFLTHVFPGASPVAIQFRREVLYLTRSSMTRPTASTMTKPSASLPRSCKKSIHTAA